MRPRHDKEDRKCLSCRLRRSDCDGADPPCDRCHQAGWSCSYDGNLDDGVYALFPPAANLNGLFTLALHDHHSDKGAFARVYKAQMGTPGRAVAVKVFFENAKVAVRALELSVREALTWMKLEHPNIVPFLGVADYAHVCYGAVSQLCIVSPWMSGGNVMDYIAANPMQDRLPFLLDIVYGLGHLHSVGIIHGDLKGNNILVDADRAHARALITDFGLSQLMDTQSSMSTTSTAFHGNARWMAPERLDPEEFNLRQSEAKSTMSDVFEMMRTFFEILTGEPPFPGLSEVAVSLAVVDGMTPKRPSVYCKGLDDVRWELLLQAWSGRRDERPSVEDVERDIRQSLWRLGSHVARREL